MDAVEFIQARDRMCAYYEENCGDCPASHMDSCGVGTKNPELLVDIVRKWTAEHCEVSKADESRNVLELMVALTDKVDRLAERITKCEQAIRVTKFGLRWGRDGKRKEKADTHGCAGGGVPGGRL